MTQKIGYNADGELRFEDDVETVKRRLRDLVNATGWLPAEETWAFASWDDPTGTITVPSGAASKYSPGMKIRITQSTGGTKYGIITKVADTVLTVYFGTDYTLNDEVISAPYYSTMKAPLGFPLDPDKWTVEVTDSTSREQVTPTQDTWYNLGSVSIDIPIGIFRVSYMGAAECTDTNATFVNVLCTLSTANNSESDNDFTSIVLLETGTDEQKRVMGNMYKNKILNLAVKDTYYFNTQTNTLSADTIKNRNDKAKLIIRAVCAYL